MADRQRDSLFYLGMDVSNLTANSELADKALQKLTKGTQEYAKVIDRYTKDDKGKKFVQRTITAISEEGERVVLTLRKQADKSDKTFKFVNATVESNLEKRRKLVESAAEKEAKAQQKAALQEEREARRKAREFERLNREYEREFARRNKAISVEVEKASKLGEKDQQTFERNAAADQLSKAFATRLGGFRSNFSDQGVINIKNIQQQIERFITTGKIASDRMDILFKAIRNGSLDSFGILTKEEKQAEIAIRSLIKAFNDASVAGKRTQDILISWQGVIRIFIVQQLHQAIGRLTNEMIRAGQEGNEFTKRIGEIQTITQSAYQKTNIWAASLKGLSDEFGTEILKTTEAAYEALSNQIGKGADVTNFLSEALIFARTTSSTAAQSVNLLSSVINAYGQTSISTRHDAEILFKTIDLGRVRAGDIANTFGNTLAIAKSLGIGLDEVSASFATLTIQGIRTDTSMTLINNIILKLLKPTKAMEELFGKWGVSSGEAAVATFGFTGVLQRLDQEFQSGGLSRIAELESDMRAIRAASALTGNSFALVEQNLQKIRNATDQYNNASKITAETLGQKLSVEINKLNNLFVADAGQEFLQLNYSLIEASGGLAKNLEPTVNGLLNLYHVAADLGTPLLYLNKHFGGLVIGMDKIIPILALGYGSFYATQQIVSFLGAAMNNLNSELLRVNLTNGVGVTTWNQLKVALFGARLGVDGTTQSLWALIAAQNIWLLGIPAVIAALTYIATSYYEEQRRITDISGEMVAKLEKNNRQFVADREQSLDRSNQILIQKLKDEQQIVLNHVAKLQRVFNQGKIVFDSLGFKFNQSDFENSLLGKDILERIPLVRDRLQELETLGNKLRLSGDVENATKIFEEYAKTIEDTNKEITKLLEDTAKEVDKLENKLIDADLENRLFGKSKQGQSSVLKTEISKLIDSGELEKAEKLAEKLVGLQETKAGHTAATKTLQDIITKQIEQQKDREQELLDARIDGEGAEREILKNLEAMDQAWKTLKDDAQQYQNIIKAIEQSLTNITGKIATQEGVLRTKIGGIVGGGAQISEFLFQKPGIIGGAAGPDPQKIKQAESIYKQIKALEELSKNPSANPQEIIKAKQELLKTVAELEQLAKPNGFSITTFGEQLVGNTGDTLFKVLKDFRQSLIGLPDEVNVLSDLQKQQTDLTTKHQEIMQASVQMAGQLKQFGDQFKDVVPEMINGVNTLENVTQNILTITQRIVDSAATISSGLGVPREGKVLGGRLMGFAPGGLLRGPYGRDNRPFMGHDGEFVVNSEATRMFYPQLVAMNSGMQNYNSGGPITNVGDININAQMTGNTSQDVVALGRQLRREIQRGTVRL